MGSKASQDKRFRVSIDKNYSATTLSIKNVSLIMLSVVMLAECCYAECRGAKNYDFLNMTT